MCTSLLDFVTSAALLKGYTSKQERAQADKKSASFASWKEAADCPVEVICFVLVVLIKVMSVLVVFIKAFLFCLSPVCEYLLCGATNSFICWTVFMAWNWLYWCAKCHTKCAICALPLIYMTLFMHPGALSLFIEVNPSCLGNCV